MRAKEKEGMIMPWFITAIIGKETIIKSTHPRMGDPYCLLHRRCHTFGFYNTYNEAYEAVKENRGNMEECLYEYIVMEYIEPGVHPTVYATQWWAWNVELKSWRFLPEAETPKEFIGICKWALG